MKRAFYLTVLHKLLASGSDRAAERWKEACRIPGAEAIDLHQLYRAMPFPGTPDRKKAPCPAKLHEGSDQLSTIVEK